MQQDLKKTLWAAADKLRSSMDAAEYKHIVLGLIFLKYISDAFDERRDDLEGAFADEACDLYLPDPEDRVEALEERDYYTMVNCFWVPRPARWETIRANAKQADIGTRIDLALNAIEADNPRLKGILDKRFGRAQLEPGKLGELIDLISTLGFTSSGGHHAKDLLDEVYVNSRKKRVGMEVYIDHDNSKSMFKQLLAQKEAIEAELKVTLDWQELPDGQACRIIQLRLDSPLEDEAQWPSYFAWLEGAALRMTEVFRSRVKALT